MQGSRSITQTVIFSEPFLVITILSLYLSPGKFFGRWGQDEGWLSQAYLNPE